MEEDEGKYIVPDKNIQRWYNISQLEELISYNTSKYNSDSNTDDNGNNSRTIDDYYFGDDDNDYPNSNLDNNIATDSFIQLNEYNILQAQGSINNNNDNNSSFSQFNSRPNFLFGKKSKISNSNQNLQISLQNNGKPGGYVYLKSVFQHLKIIKVSEVIYPILIYTRGIFTPNLAL